MIDCDKLIRLCGDYGIPLSREAAARLDTYASLLVEWNQKMNLTAITDPEGMVLKHFTDSLTALPLLPETKGVSLIDVGTGAGFPGVPLAIARPDIRLTLLDSLNKRLVFLKELCAAVDVPVTLVHARAEEGARKPEWREQFDVATARAVAALPTLCEYCLPFVRTGGRFIAMKGPDGEAELKAAGKAMALLGGKPQRVEHIHLPKNPEPGEETMDRCLIVIQKTGVTPSQYPRPSAKIAKAPL